MTTLEQRFWAKVRLPEGSDGCLEWMGSFKAGGYGGIRIGGKVWRAHRFSYELMVGPIPEGMVIDHLCRNRACVRPDHLEAVTQRVNILRGNGLPAIRSRQTHCHNEHEFTEENTYIWRTSRRCRMCRRKRERK